MIAWPRARTWGLAAYGVIVALVVGGLGWVTAAALRLELSDQLRLALWRLDSRVSPALAREDSRPFQHFDAFYVPLPAIQPPHTIARPGAVWVPSPLLSTDLPDWLLMHFQVTAEGRWRSPEVLTAAVANRLRGEPFRLDLRNITAQRTDLLAALTRYSPNNLLRRLPETGDTLIVPGYLQNPTAPLTQAINPPASQFLSGQPGDNDLGNRARQQNAIQAEARKNVDSTLGFSFDAEFPWADLGGKPGGAGNGLPTVVRLGLLQPLWLRADGEPDRLVLARLAQAGTRKVVQGVLLDWPRLSDILRAEIADLFPEAQLRPVFDDQPATWPERQMTALPVELDPGPRAGSILGGWSPLRVGLVLAWLAALAALVVVGFGGWSLLDLSERRIRFVSAVTHELRTPLTTLRLYLDMLNSGLVRDEAQKTDYLKTLDAESQRLNRLVANVLDFARLEKQRPRLSLSEIQVGDILERLRESWRERCTAAGKELVVEMAPGCQMTVMTDVELIQQVLGNLIDNACKYSRSATDARIWLRARPDGQRWLVLEVEDHGPGIPAGERRNVFRAFCRGRSADVIAGGVGLGLALAGRWARLLGGKLILAHRPTGGGACFQFWLPAQNSTSLTVTRPPSP